MVVNKQKKNRAQRGSRTHGWGHPKKHRGAGSRGGVGKSGMGKRGQHKMSLLNSLGIKNLGSHGFTRPPSLTLTDRTINLGEIDASISKWLSKKIAKEEKGMVSIDVSELGFGKVLGSGKISGKMIIKAEKFSERAKEKIEHAGGRAEETGKKETNEKQAKNEKNREAPIEKLKKPTKNPDKKKM